ncbi:hypothetical protein ACFL4G_00525 [Thermodesulfobacteriota bacterium]
MKRETRILWAVLIASLLLAAMFAGCQNGTTPPADPEVVDSSPINYPSGAYKYLEFDKVNDQVGGRLQLGSIDFNGDTNFMVSSNGEVGDDPDPIGNPLDWGFYQADEGGSLYFEGAKASFQGRFNGAADLILTPRILGMAGSEGFGVGIKSEPQQFVGGPVPVDGGAAKPVRTMEGVWGLFGLAHGYGGGVEGANTIIGTITIDQSHSFNTFSSMIWVGDGTMETGSGQFEINENGDVEFDVDGFGMDFVAFPNQSDSIFTAYSASTEQGMERRIMAVAVKIDDQHPLPDEGSFHIYRFVEDVDGDNVALDEGLLSFGPDSSFQVDCGEFEEEGVMVVEEFEKSFMLHVYPEQGDDWEAYGYAGVLDASGDVLLLGTPNNPQDQVAFIIGFRVR